MHTQQTYPCTQSVALIYDTIFHPFSFGIAIACREKRERRRSKIVNCVKISNQHIDTANFMLYATMFWMHIFLSNRSLCLRSLCDSVGCIVYVPGCPSHPTDFGMNFSTVVHRDLLLWVRRFLQHKKYYFHHFDAIRRRRRKKIIYNNRRRHQLSFGTPSTDITPEEKKLHSLSIKFQANSRTVRNENRMSEVVKK